MQVTRNIRVMTSAANELIAFINASPSPFHAVAEAERRLASAGFTKLQERDLSWNVQPGKSYYVTRNQSAVIAFSVGGRYEPGNGFTIASAHTDSPCLRVKPISKIDKNGYLSLGVETYGGGIWATWFDRDLSVAGRVIVNNNDGTFTSKLVRIDRPICRVPTLAIHLDRTINDGWKINTENHLPPILATAVKDTLSKEITTETGALGRHHTALVVLLAEHLQCKPEDIQDFELSLYDTQKAALGGIFSEFVYAPRLDNLCMTHTIFEGLIRAVTNQGSNGDSLPLEEDSNIRIAASFDHEEVGSSSVPGAGSNFLEDVLNRLVSSNPASLPAAIRKSILVSADMAHALHPNYPTKHEDNHRPAMHSGLVIKSNTNQRYATTSVTAFLFRELAAKAGVPLQDFCVRQDMGCGSTIGPIVATRLGLRTVDIGIPQLSMHSCREMCGADDVAYGLKFFTEFWGRFPIIDNAVRESD